MEIYYSQAKIKDAEDAVAYPERFDGKIEFRDVSFQYEDGDLPVLHDISFANADRMRRLRSWERPDAERHL